MSKFELNPKNGWAHASDEEVTKLMCNNIGEHHAMNPEVLYDLFNKIPADIESYAHKLMGSNTLESNKRLMGALFNDDIDGLKEYLGV